MTKGRDVSGIWPTALESRVTFCPLPMLTPLLDDLKNHYCEKPVRCLLYGHARACQPRQTRQRVSQIRGQHPSTPARGAPVPTELHQHLKGHSDQVSGRVRRVSSAVQRKWPEWDLARLAHDPGYTLHPRGKVISVRRCTSLFEGMSIRADECHAAAGCGGAAPPSWCPGRESR